jgi:hypothetical protein
MAPVGRLLDRFPVLTVIVFAVSATTNIHGAALAA